MSRPARMVTPRRRRLVCDCGWRFVTFRRRRRRRRIAWAHCPGSRGMIGVQLDDVIRIEWPANARSGVAPPARAFRIVGAHRRAREIGGVVRALVSHDWSTTGRNRREGQRGVVQAVGSEREADDHGSRARGPVRRCQSSQMVPRPPLGSFVRTSFDRCARGITLSSFVRKPMNDPGLSFVSLGGARHAMGSLLA